MKQLAHHAYPSLLLFLLILATLRTLSRASFVPEKEEIHQMKEKLRAHLISKIFDEVSIWRNLPTHPKRERSPKMEVRKLYGKTVNSWDQIQPGSTYGIPQRVRIFPFGLVLAPTPVQLMRGDEDQLLTDLQELITLFMKSQFGIAGSKTNERGVMTTLEYVLFSDIDQNAWTQGKNSLSDEPRTVLRLNGGVASFSGPDTPSEAVVNGWVQTATNSLLVSALEKTRYDYIQIARYMDIKNLGTTVDPDSIVLNPGAQPTSAPLQLINEAKSKTSPSSTRAGIVPDKFSLTTLLASTIAGFVVIIVILVLWIGHNNRVVNVLHGKREENQDEDIDLANCEDITESQRRHSRKADNDAKDDGATVDRGNRADVDRGNRAGDAKRDIAVATQSAIDEASLQESLNSGSEFTIPTVSAASIGSANKFNGLSFRNPNPFKKNILLHESFQEERQTHLSKDMMLSKWTVSAPDLDTMKGKRHEETVLKPSYFSAAKEREYLSKDVLEPYKNTTGISNNLRHKDREKPFFQVKQAHERVEEETEGFSIMSIRPDRESMYESSRTPGDIV